MAVVNAVAALQEPPTDHDDRVALAAAITTAFRAAHNRVAAWDLPDPPKFARRAAAHRRPG